MNSEIIDILNGISSATKELNIKELPTQGKFYPIDFTLHIRKASFDDIMLYNFNYVKDDLGVILKETKRIIRKNIILGDKYKYEDFLVSLLPKLKESGKKESGNFKSLYYSHI